MTKRLYYIFALVLLFSACKKKAAYSVVDLFDKTEELKSQSLEIEGFQENILNPNAIEVLKDKLVLIDDKSSVPFSVIDLHNQKYLNSFGKKGEGPGEIIGVMDFYVNNERTGINCWDAMLRRLYFCDKDSMLFLNGKCGINILDHTKNKKLFNNFYSNVIQINDSIFLAIGNSGEKRFTLVNTKNEKIQQTGDYPKQDLVNGVNPTIKAAAYHGMVRYNKKKNRLVYISRNSEMIELFKVKDSGVELLFGNYTTIPIYEQVNSTMGTTIKRESNNIGMNMSLSASDDYIFILSRPRMYQDKEDAADDVLVFDWNGKPVRHYKLDKKVTSISLLEKPMRLYALTNNESPQIIYYDLDI